MADLSTVARPYARAVFDVALAANALESWSKALAAAAAVTADAAAREYLSQPALGAAERAEFMSGVLSGVDDAAELATEAGRNLLRLLSENDRLGALPDIAARFDELKSEQENKVRVTLVAATEVDAAQAEKVAASLRSKLGREIDLELEVDPSLIGGAVIRAQDRVIDGSLQTRLKRLASSLID